MTQEKQCQYITPCGWCTRFDRECRIKPVEAPKAGSDLHFDLKEYIEQLKEENKRWEAEYGGTI